MKPTSYFIFVCFFSVLYFFVPTRAQDFYPWELKCLQGAMESMPSFTNSCSAPKINLKPKCSDLTDDLCQTLWSKKNQGHLKVGDGSISIGDSDKSEMASYRIMDLKALVDSEARLPQDLQEKAKPILEDLKLALTKENNSKAWLRSISEIMNRWEQAIEETANDRTENQHPSLKNKKYKDLTIEEKALYKTDYHQIKGLILDAKYAQHPNWTRVERVFKQAKDDIIAEIQELKIPEAQKRNLIDKISSAKVSLPYTDPNTMNASDSCGATVMNAYYIPDSHTFTVCAGFFNGYQSDSAMYGTVAHELSHAIDPIGNADAYEKKNGYMYTNFGKLAGTTGPSIPCDQWQKMVDKAKQWQPKKALVEHDAMQPLYDCLHPKKDLAKFERTKLQEISEKNARETISLYASDHSFLTLAQPTVTKNDEVTSNEFYLRPDRMKAAENGYVFDKKTNRDPNQYEIFTQALACSSLTRSNKKITIQNANPDEKAQLFDQAIKVTSELSKIKFLEWFTICGKNCDSLTSDNLSIDSKESFSDWMEYKALSRFLSRKSNLRDRREASALATVDLCESPGPKRDAPKLAKTEKKYSLENHPDTRARRLSVFNRKTAQLVECEIDKLEQGQALCEL